MSENKKENIDMLLEKLKKAKTDEERKQIIEDNKSELTDKELEQVNGGTIITEGRACW